MAEYNTGNNNISLIGKISSELEFNHKVHGEGFFSFILEVERLSDNMDKIPVLVSERLLSNLDLKIGDLIGVSGQFRSYNNYTNEGNKLILTAFARKISVLSEIDKNNNPNQVILNGFICKTPIFRTTPFGREIADLLLAVNRAYNKSDYIPCIAWGRNARFAETLKVGDNIKVWGRVQSREYQKKFESGEVETRMAYEVSISKLEMAEDDKSDTI